MEFSPSGQVISPDKVRDERIRNGYCSTCRVDPTQCFIIKKKLVGLKTERIPLTIPSKVYNGLCLKCHPDRDPDASSVRRIRHHRHRGHHHDRGYDFQGHERQECDLFHAMPQIDCAPRPLPLESRRVVWDGDPFLQTNYLPAIEESVFSQFRSLIDQQSKIHERSDHDENDNSLASRRVILRCPTAVDEECVSGTEAYGAKYNIFGELLPEFRETKMKTRSRSSREKRREHSRRSCIDHIERKIDIGLKSDDQNHSTQQPLVQTSIYHDSSHMSPREGLKPPISPQFSQSFSLYSSFRPQQQSTFNGPERVVPNYQLAGPPTPIYENSPQNVGGASDADVSTLLELVADFTKSGTDEMAIDVITEALATANSVRKSVDLISFCFTTLWFLAHKSDENKRKIFGSRGTFEVVVEVMGAYNNISSDIQRRGCGLLWALSMDRYCRKHVSQLGGCGAILNAMSVHIKDDSVQIMALGALKVVASDPFGLSTLRLSGAPCIIADSMTNHIENTTIQLDGCSILDSLLVEADHSTQLVSQKIVDALINAILAYPDSIDILSKACHMLESIASSTANLEIIRKNERSKVALKLALQKHKKDVNCNIHSLFDQLYLGSGTGQRFKSCLHKK